MAGTGYRINSREVEMWGRRTSQKTADRIVQFTITSAGVYLPLIYLPPGSPTSLLPPQAIPLQKKTQVSIVLLSSG